jgi:hypothetical protein
LQPYGDTGTAYFPAYGRKLAGAAFLARARTGAAASNPERASWQMKTRLRFLPAGPL